MPRLNLDIFSSEATGAVKKEDSKIVGRSDTATPTIEIVPENALDSQTRANSNNQGPKFIPVGFYPRHLSLLDDAVLKLRRSGHWQASKSAIIRNLIEANAGDLERFGQRNI
ncbi:MAG TPA: hypothetical protein PLL36_07835 [Candidatus Hydrogenedentes bacterium]|nr:hypothetical protein [Candidatus Hydrogenedentota bacterium]HQN00968.1 hypothetical protein [Candidatus Hydrogenedentota bacterium]